MRNVLFLIRLHSHQLFYATYHVGFTKTLSSLHPKILKTNQIVNSKPMSLGSSNLNSIIMSHNFNCSHIMRSEPPRPFGNISGASVAPTANTACTGDWSCPGPLPVRSGGRIQDAGSEHSRTHLVVSTPSQNLPRCKDTANWQYSRGSGGSWSRWNMVPLPLVLSLILSTNYPK